LDVDSAVKERLRDAGLKRRRFPLDVFEDAQQLYNATEAPSWRAIADELARLHPEGAPSESALRQWAVKGIITKEAEDAPWTLGRPGFTPEDDRLILQVISRFFLVETAYLEAAHDELHQWRPSHRTAKWLIRITRAGGFNLARWHEMMLAVHLARMATAGRTDEVTAVLAVDPWRVDSNTLDVLVRVGWVRPETVAKITELRTSASSDREQRRRSGRHVDRDEHIGMLDATPETD